MTEKQLTHLKQLEAESIHIIREVAAEFENPVMLYSIGKDSSVVLHLALKSFYPSKPPFPLVHVDTLERWVRVDIEASGSRIRASFDGQLTAELVNERSLSGVIALQYGGTGTLKFKNLNIESN